jgi:hypothetical protein
VRAPDDVDRLSSVPRGVVVLGCSFWLDVVCSHFLAELSMGGACGAAPAASVKVVMPIVSAIFTTRCMGGCPFAMADAVTIKGASHVPQGKAWCSVGQGDVPTSR